MNKASSSFLRLWMVAGILANPAMALASTQRADAPSSSEASTLPEPASLPVGRHATWASDAPAGVDRQATVLPQDDEGFLLVYAQYAGGDMDSSRLMQIRSPDGRHVSPPIPLSFGSTLEDAPVLARSGDQAWLYFAASEGDYRNLKLWRAQVNREGFLQPQRLPHVQGLKMLTQSPRWVRAGEDLFLTFRGSGSGPQWLSLRGGHSPAAVTTLVDTAVAYPRVVPMGGGGCFFSYQRVPEGGYMTTLYRVSPDCRTWAEPIELAPATPPNKTDVHDGFALPRPEGGVDVYYVYPSFKGSSAPFPVGFNLYRRAIDVHGAQGPEQLLTDPISYNPFAPSAHRMADGTVLVTFSDIQQSSDQGVSKARLTLFRVAGDAPAASVQRSGGGDDD
ncbi:hypothetical protein [Stenotrophomonas sp. CFBP 13725]|uniref:hypothetical protein n=1 Tax=Stenotrophomonas sp. CFBP 13725 TaxID=2775297 RepID=UPI001783FFAD|nr:hypothetical protein [Stenotrophomonas sp. CFBP 13725]MBD8635425.1 hypothetical protein [Stenotrophomonas sp. CFBP 13725]